MPEVLKMQILLVDARSWLFAAGMLAGGVLLMLAAHFVIFLIAQRVAKRRETFVLLSFIHSIKGPLRLLLVVAGLLLALPFVALPPRAGSAINHALELGIIAGVGWTFVEIARFLAGLVASRFRIDTADNLAARRVRTQTQVMERVATMAIVIVTAAVMLMTFPEVRQIGASVLASAGIAGLVIGMAAKSTFSSLIAGLQVAITQPIRLEDVVIVEDEWGWIEEIETTYVVVRLWDLRRLIVPLNYFIEHPFQNWTRTTADLLGTAVIYTDYTVPVNEVREELHRILKETDLWDGKSWGLQVTELTENSMQLRALMSAPDSGKAWDLRCLVRERLVQFLQEKHPGSLPMRREKVEVRGLEKAVVA
jgi:small-conductance mechanosensitive channel